MWAVLMRWLNREKAVFFTAVAWLLVTGLSFQCVPAAKRWGPARADDAPRKRSPASLETPPPIGEFLAGGRGSPFTELRRTSAFRPPGLPTVRPPRRPRPRTETAQKKPAVLPPPPEPKAEAAPAVRPKPYDLPVKLVGRIGDRVVFAIKEDGRYVSVREGEELAGLGVKLVSATKNIVIVENEEGRRFWLADLLRASAAGGGGGEELE
jgi:hypothetical protein